MGSGHAGGPLRDESAARRIEDDHVVAGVIGQKQQAALRVDHDSMAVFHVHLGQSLASPVWHHLITKLALAEEVMDERRLFALKEEMEKAEARRLQPFFIRSFFMKAFQQLGGSIHPREPGRFEVTFVPASIRERDRQITGRNRRDTTPVLKRYERVCFEKQYVRLMDRTGSPSPTS